jgi:glycosyltransferase involved in cell wall biosynthesis
MGAPAARAAELARHWASSGHEPTILTGFPNHPTGCVPPEWRSRFRRLLYRETADGVRVVRTWLWPLPNRQAYERALNYSSFCASAALSGLTIPKPDVVIGTSPQLLVGLSAWWIARLKRAPFVFEVRDLWPESLVAVGMGDSDSLLHRTLGRIAGFLYRQSDHIVVVTPAFKDHLIKHWAIAPEKISIVENGVETDLFQPAVDFSAKRKELGVEDRFLVCYVGTMGWAHGLETLIEAAALLQTRAPLVQFLLIGEGADKARIQALAQERELTNLTFLDQQPRERIPEFISASDACLVLLRKTDVFKTVIPTKMLEFMACARPLILAVDGQARSIMDAAQAGIHVEPENPGALADAILQLAGDVELRSRLGKNGRNYIVDKFSRRQTAETYVKVLKEVLNSTKQRNRQPNPVT